MWAKDKETQGHVYNSESKKAGFDDTQAFILDDRSVFIEICQPGCDTCDLQMIKLKRKMKINFVTVSFSLKKPKKHDLSGVHLLMDSYQSSVAAKQRSEFY